MKPLHDGFARTCSTKKSFRRFMSQFGFINEARGRGLLLGMACSVPAAPIVAKCMEKGLLVLSAGPDVVRLLPPLNISADEVDEAMGIMEGVLCEVESEIEVER